MESGYCSTSDMVRRVRSQTPVYVVEETLELSPSPFFAAFEATCLALSFVCFNSNSQLLIQFNASVSGIPLVFGFGG